VTAQSVARGPDRFEVTRVGVDEHRYDRVQDQSREGMESRGPRAALRAPSRRHRR
jgi:hypothetical protein